MFTYLVHSGTKIYCYEWRFCKNQTWYICLNEMLCAYWSWSLVHNTLINLDISNDKSSLDVYEPSGEEWLV